jgi:hypothetical protein
MHFDKKRVIENLQLTREIAQEEYGDDSTEVVLKVAGLIASQEIKAELGEVTGCLLHPLEIHGKRMDCWPYKTLTILCWNCSGHSAQHIDSQIPLKENSYFAKSKHLKVQMYSTMPPTTFRFSEYYQPWVSFRHYFPEPAAPIHDYHYVPFKGSGIYN